MFAGKSVDENIVGVLHDVIEDSAWTIDMLRAEGFSETVIDALVFLTKLSDDEPYDITNKCREAQKLCQLRDIQDEINVEICVWKIFVSRDLELVCK